MWCATICVWRSALDQLSAHNFGHRYWCGGCVHRLRSICQRVSAIHALWCCFPRIGLILYTSLPQRKLVALSSIRRGLKIMIDIWQSFLPSPARCAACSHHPAAIPASSVQWQVDILQQRHGALPKPLCFPLPARRW